MDTSKAGQFIEYLNSLDSTSSVDEIQTLAAQWHSAGELEAALAAFERATELCPEEISLWHALATVCSQLDLPHRALDACNRALQLSPDNPQSIFNAGAVLAMLGDTGAALHCYEKVLVSEPQHYGALRNRPMLMAAQGLKLEARQAAEQALSAYPHDPWLHYNLGELLLGMLDAAGAISAFDHALMLAPEFHQARYARALALAADGQVRCACDQQAIALSAEPELANSYRSPLILDVVYGTHDLNPARIAILAAFEKLRSGEWQKYYEVAHLFGELIEGLHGAPPLDQHEMPYLALGMPIGENLRQQLARQVAARAQEKIAGKRLIRPRRMTDERLRIAYLGAGFRCHPNAQLMGDIYRRHDRQDFVVHAYALGPADDGPERARVIGGVDVFRDIEHLPAEAAAQLIVNDGIDILVDLSGYTRHARPEILALRPAAVQLSYMDFMGTLGAPWIDYALLDRNVLMPQVRKHWDEHIANLPYSSYHCEKPPRLPAMPARESLGLPVTALVLGALHSPRKFEPLTWACWMELLHELPQAVLWLMHETPEQKIQLLSNAEAFGIAAARLIFAPFFEHTAHLSRLRQADIFLDTFLYNGHTTTIDALGAGVPVVTLRGDSVVTRVAASMLIAHGLPELIANSVDEYKASVHRLAEDPEWRAEIRRRAGSYEQSNLFCPERRVREIETAYEMMWARHIAGLPPEDFDVPEYKPSDVGK